MYRTADMKSLLFFVCVIAVYFMLLIVVCVCVWVKMLFQCMSGCVFPVYMRVDL